jgi:hypothetical protein
VTSVTFFLCPSAAGSGHGIQQVDDRSVAGSDPPVLVCLEAAMRSADDLIRQANVLADHIRRARADVRAPRAQHAHDISAMQSELTALWAAIRAARVEGIGGAHAAAPPEPRRSYPKWG